MTKQQDILGNRIRLTALRLDDVPELARWYKDPEFLRLYEGPSTVTRNERETTDWLILRRRDKNSHLYAIRLLDSEDLIGMIDIVGLNSVDHVGWMGIAIGDVAQRHQGYGSEAMHLFLDAAFSILGLQTIKLVVYNYNQPAIALYEKLGFDSGGIYRSGIRRDGSSFKMMLYTINRNQWETRRKNKDNRPLI